jgi:transcriptional regulator with XRE-family HTH domain
VRATRQRRGWTLEQVAHRIARMDAKYLGEIERGWHAPSVPTAKRIADALDVPLSELVKQL